MIISRIGFVPGHATELLTADSIFGKLFVSIAEDFNGANFSTD